MITMTVHVIERYAPRVDCLKPFLMWVSHSWPTAKKAKKKKIKHRDTGVTVFKIHKEIQVICVHVVYC